MTSKRLAANNVAYFSNLNVEAIFFSETSLYFHRTVGCCIPATAVISSNPALKLLLVYRQEELNVL
jgi:hypothetical protein